MRNPMLIKSSLLALILTDVAIAESLPDKSTQQISIEEIVVTAKRRSESVNQVPLSITALGESKLDQRGIKSFEDFTRSIPAVSFSDSGGFGNEVKMRGIGLGNFQLSPTTAVYLGEVPVIHTGRNASSSYDFRITDMARIEILRGPQGQLFGSNSLGGAIRNIPNSASADHFEFTGNLSAGAINDGGNDSSIDAVLNIPFNDSVALRLVVYDATYGGYYRNRFTGGTQIGLLPPNPFGPPLGLFLTPEQLAYKSPAIIDKETNKNDVQGGRLLLNWQVNSDMDIQLMVAAEQKEIAGASYAELKPGVTDYKDFEHFDATISDGEDDIFLTNLVINYEFSNFRLTSSTSYWERESVLSRDFSEIPLLGPGSNNVVPIDTFNEGDPSSFIQEFRLTSTGDSKLQWLAGVFYQEIDQDFRLSMFDLSGLDIIATAFGSPTPVMGLVDANYKDEQIAIFGELKYQLSETVSAAFSWRWFEVDQDFDRSQAGFFFAGNPVTSGSNRESVFTPKLELTWKPNEDFLVYALAAEGFRTGVVNRPVPISLCGTALTNAGMPGGIQPSDADTLWNFEVGAKMGFMDNRAQLNVSIFEMRWKDMQSSFFLTTFDPNPFSQCRFDAISNVGDATSRGVEMEFSYRISENWQLDLAGSYIDASYDDNSPFIGARKDDRIQGVARHQTYIGLQYDFNLFSRPGYIQVNWTHVGDIDPAPTDFPFGQAVAIGDYDTVNLRIAFNINQNFSVELFGHNLGDDYGVTNAFDTGGAADAVISTSRPRTLGAGLKWAFN